MRKVVIMFGSLDINNSKIYSDNIVYSIVKCTYTGIIYLLVDVAWWTTKLQDLDSC